MNEPGVWSEERVELLKKLWGDGLSASQIAGELGGVTRNAVIGKVHRLGLSGRAKSPAAATPSASAAPRPRKAAPLRNPAHPMAAAGLTHGANALAPDYETQAQGAVEPASEPVSPPSEDVVVPFSERVTIMDLRESMCRWPMGDPTTPEFRFCGARSGSGMPYCTHHSRIAYQPAADRRRDRGKMAVRG